MMQQRDLEWILWILQWGVDIGHSALLKYFTKRVMREKRWGESAEHPLRIIIRMVRGLGRIISY